MKVAFSPSIRTSRRSTSSAPTRSSAAGPAPRSTSWRAHRSRSDCDRGLTVVPTDTPAQSRRPAIWSSFRAARTRSRVLEDEVTGRLAAHRSAELRLDGVGVHAAPGCTPSPAYWKARRRPRTGDSGTTSRAIGVTVVADRVVWEGTHVSGAGVSAGIDMALALTERVHGRDLGRGAAAGHRVRPGASVRRGLGREGEHQDASARDADHARRPPGASGGKVQQANGARTGPSRARHSLRAAGDVAPMMDEP